MPRAGLTRDRVVDEAVAVIDATGWSQLTLAAVAQRCGVKLPSLYKHVESLDALRGDVAARCTRELADVVMTAAVGAEGSQALHRVGHAYRDYAVAHPGRYAATVRPPTQPGEHEAATRAVLDVVLAVLAGYGLTGDTAIDAARALRAGLHGFASLETSGGFGIPQDVDRSFDVLLDGLDDLLRGLSQR